MENFVVNNSITTNDNNNDGDATVTFALPNFDLQLFDGEAPEGYEYEESTHKATISSPEAWAWAFTSGDYIEYIELSGSTNITATASQDLSDMTIDLTNYTGTLNGAFVKSDADVDFIYKDGTQKLSANGASTSGFTVGVTKSQGVYTVALSTNYSVSDALKIAKDNGDFIVYEITNQGELTVEEKDGDDTTTSVLKTNSSLTTANLTEYKQAKDKGWATSIYKLNDALNVESTTYLSEVKTAVNNGYDGIISDNFVIEYDSQTSTYTFSGDPETRDSFVVDELIPKTSSETASKLVISSDDITKFDQEEFADELIGEDEIPF
jgi:hypothetical protein